MNGRLFRIMFVRSHGECAAWNPDHPRMAGLIGQGYAFRKPSLAHAVLVADLLWRVVMYSQRSRVLIQINPAVTPKVSAMLAKRTLIIGRSFADLPVGQFFGSPVQPFPQK